MEYIRYRKPTDSMNKTGMTKGVKTAPMKVTFKDGVVPYSVGQIVIVRFKQTPTVALVEKINEHSITVVLEKIAGKKVILFQNVLQVVS